MKIEGTFASIIYSLFGPNGAEILCSRSETRRFAVLEELERHGVVVRSEVTPEFPNLFKFTPQHKINR